MAAVVMAAAIGVAAGVPGADVPPLGGSRSDRQLWTTVEELERTWLYVQMRDASTSCLASSFSARPLDVYLVT